MISDNPRLAVLIPTFRRPVQLVRLLRSLSEQSRLPEQIIVACRHDDTDSMRAVELWARTSSLPFRHSIATVGEPGHLPPLLAGLAACAADVVCQIDDDAVPEKDWLLFLGEDFRDPTVGAVGGTVLNHHQDRNSPEVATPGKLSWFGRSGKYGRMRYDNLFEADCPIGANMAYRKDAIQGRIDMVLNGGSAISFETDLFLEIKRKGYQVFYDPRVIVDHYPAPRRIEALRGWNRNECYHYAHNLTYICLKHLPWYGKIGFLLYFFVGGTWGCPGIATFLLSLCQGRPASVAEQLIPSFRGRAAGIRSYLRNSSPKEDDTLTDCGPVTTRRGEQCRR